MVYRKIKNLLKSINIKYRVYTSASPNTELIEKNEEIFGELFKEINVKELIQLKYLCNIKPFIFEINENSIDYCKTIIKDFREYKRSWGLSFHNKCLNAFHIFLKHYEVYKHVAVMFGNSIAVTTIPINKRKYTRCIEN